MTAFATLAMYPMEPLRPAWERMWDAVHQHTGWTPDVLTWVDDVQAAWVDPDCVVAHTCGWPVATTLADVVDVVGAFAFDIPGAEGPRSRAAIMASRPGPLDSFVTADTVAAVNSECSLTGWISMRVATVGGQPWPGPVVWTGAHVASLAALQDGRADIASIDPLTLALVQRHQPELTAGLHEVGRGPLVPSTPIVVPRGTDPACIADLRDALAAAVADPAVRATDELFITAFVPLDRDVYDGLATLVPTR
ncbi:hypothetical protein BH24ACT5_BH24ACT5_15730 [soil metagenome]